MSCPLDEVCASGAATTASCRGAVEERIDIPGAGDLKAGEAFDGTESSDDLLRDDLGRLAQGARELQGDGRGDFAEMQVGRRLQRDVRDVERVFFFQHGAKAIGEPFFQFQNHARASKILDFQGDFNRACLQSLSVERPRGAVGHHNALKNRRSDSR